jgi:hypothetical protein
MGDMPGSTFHASRTERLRRRTGGPALTLVRGTGGSHTPTRDVRPAHPAQPGFTPDDIPSDARGTAVQDSEPGSPTVEHLSRGNAALDIDGRASTGSGPINLRNPDLVRLVRLLQALTDGADGGHATGIRSIR